MIPRIIHHVWIGSELPERFHSFVSSARVLHPTWCHYFWDTIPRFNPQLKLSALASISNYMRLEILYQHGGIYLDTDVECLKSFEPLRRESAFAAFQDETRICNAVMGAEWGHPWIKWQLDNAREKLNDDPATGVYLATEAPRNFLTIVERHLIYPWVYGSAPELRKPHPDSFCAHQWEGSWVKK